MNVNDNGRTELERRLLAELSQRHSFWQSLADPKVLVPIFLFLSGLIGIGLRFQITLDESDRQLKELQEQVARDRQALQARFDRLDVDGTSYVRGFIQLHGQRLDQLERSQTSQDRTISSLSQSISNNSGRLSVIESRINRLENPTP